MRKTLLISLISLSSCNMHKLNRKNLKIIGKKNESVEINGEIQWILKNKNNDCNSKPTEIDSWELLKGDIFTTNRDRDTVNEFNSYHVLTYLGGNKFSCKSIFYDTTETIELRSFAKYTYNSLSEDPRFLP